MITDLEMFRLDVKIELTGNNESDSMESAHKAIQLNEEIEALTTVIRNLKKRIGE
jgi:hypothetical protein